jgi:hypothetical protein
LDEKLTASPTDALLSVLRMSLTADGTPAFGHLVLYTSFGVVKGRAGFAFVQAMTRGEDGFASESDHPIGAIELSDVTVEHYSNHLATASFDRLYVRLQDVQGFALVGPQGQA